MTYVSSPLFAARISNVYWSFDCRLYFRIATFFWMNAKPFTYSQSSFMRIRKISFDHSMTS